jgi:hypothetical protein
VPEVPTSSDDLHAVCAKVRSFTYTWEKNGVVLANENSPSLPRNRFAKNDEIKVNMRIGNETGSAKVFIVNAPPRVTSVSFSPEEIYTGTDITAIAQAQDSDGETIGLKYKWTINGKELTENVQVLKGDRFKKGDNVSLVVVPFDNGSEGAPYKTRTVTIPNAPPHFTSTPPLEFGNAVYTYHAMAADPDGDRLTYSIESGPGGMKIDSGTGMITWRITAGDEGPHIIEITARDPEGAQVTQRYSLNISLNNGFKQ